MRIHTINLFFSEVLHQDQECQDHEVIEEEEAQGGFQLLNLIITELKSHMTCYNSMPLIG